MTWHGICNIGFEFALMGEGVRRKPTGENGEKVTGKTGLLLRNLS